MRTRVRLVSLAVFSLSLLIALPGLARPKKSRKPPSPLNKEVKYEAYKGTDVAQIIYKTSRKEFRVGHAPYLVVRFHVAEFVLVTGHIRKYLRQDYKAEIKMAPGNSKPALMANKTFQARWQEMTAAQEKLVAQVKQMKIPAECTEARETFLKALSDELFLAKKIAERMFPAQDIRSRERLREDLTKRFRSRDAEWFDRLFTDFEKDADLSKLYPRFVDLLIQPVFDKAKEQTQRAMAKVGVEYATPVEEEGDITAP